MGVVLICGVFSVVLSVLMLCIGWVLVKHWEALYDLSSPFECGFDPGGSSRVGFSLRFFVLMILFVVFDFETVLLIPCVFWFNSWLASWFSVFNFLGFLVVLLIGVFYEMKEGALEWKC
uniref:NADH-ubiquinone oxidoreductase chain 3 n=1 Tax=Monodontina vondembuschiana TaxID=2508272 RepID=A0A513X0G4_9BIVA|nr:NADH dehydrogenase subunit 3 [Monodontina vondembuschiana]